MALAPYMPVGRNMGEEKMPDFIDGIDDFQKQRWLHKRETRLKAADKSNQARLARDRERSLWITEGKAAIQSTKKAFGGIEGILGPHRDHKRYCQQLDAFASELARQGESVVHYHYSKRLLQVVCPPTKSKKVDLIRHWWTVMSEMRRGKDLSEFFHGKCPNELRALRIREHGERSLVPIAPDVLADLMSKRAWKRKTLAQLKLIRETRDQHMTIPECKSLLHLTPAGCPKCGVIHIGGSRDVVQYVRSVHRQTGVVTLQTLAQELKNLDDEESDEKSKLLAASEGIDSLEKMLFIHSRDTIQAWWPCVLAKWRAQRAARRMNSSIWFYRIRRLVKMKRILDATDENQLDFDYLVGEFPDVRDALEEYIKVVQDRRKIVAEKVAKVFLTNLRKAVAWTRKKEYLRQERIKSEGMARDMALSTKKKELFLMAMRKRVQVLERRKFVCIRPRCCGRQFISEDRYKTHMGLHKIEDDLRSARVEAAAKRWATASVKEEVCLQRVAEVHSNIVRDVRNLDKVGLALGLEEIDVKLALIKEAIRCDGDTSFAAPADWSAAPFSPSSNLINQSVLPGTGPGGHVTTANNKKQGPVEHLRLANAEFNSSTYHLEIVSVSGDVQAASIICLDKALIRIGTLPSLECTVLATGAVKRDAQIAKVHCIIYCPLDSDADAGIFIVDNNSRYGTYIVSEKAGATKVSTIVTEGTPLVPGNLLCIGVRRNGGETLSAVEASGACIVYRVHCRDKEGHTST